MRKRSPVWEDRIPPGKRNPIWGNECLCIGVTIYCCHPPVLQNFLNEQREAHPNVDLPDVPQTGGLDIRQVISSPYFDVEMLPGQLSCERNVIVLTDTHLLAKVAGLLDTPVRSPQPFENKVCGLV